jgi:dTDP-4-amino-4,6-dideoxygalactose transaminase
MSEFNAALGLLQLEHIDQAISKRKQIDILYRTKLAAIKGIQCIEDSGEVEKNYAYFPIRVLNDYPIGRDELVDRMKANGVHPRRYFYPLISEYPMYRDFPSSNPDLLPEATLASAQVLCLPIYPDLETTIVEEICQFIAEQ